LGIGYFKKDNSELGQTQGTCKADDSLDKREFKRWDLLENGVISGRNELYKCELPEGWGKQ
jgi:hypothetical protein